MPVFKSPGGDLVDVPVEQVERRTAEGYIPVSSGDRYAQVSQEAADARANSRGALGAINAGLTSLASGATLGLSDVALRSVLSDNEMERLRGEREAHPYVSGVSNVVGSLAPALLTGGASAPESIAALGVRTAEAGGTLARLGQAAVRGAGEGALYGAGGAVSELAMSDDPLTIEHVASSLSSHALYGAGIGAVAGTAMKGLEIGLGKARTAIAEHAAAREAAAAVPEDLAALDVKGLNAARDAEIASIKAGRVTERASIADDIATHHGATEYRAWNAVEGVEGVEGLKSLGARGAKADKALRSALDNPIELAAKPEKALGALQRQQSALEGIVAKREAILGDVALIPKPGAFEDGVEGTLNARALRDHGYQEPIGMGEDPVRLANARKAITEGQREPIKVLVSPEGRIEVVNGRHRLEAAIELNKPIRVQWLEGVEGIDSAENLARVRKVGGDDAAAFAKREAALDSIPAALERNRALQARLANVTGEVTSPRLSAIANAKDVLATGAAKQPGMIEKAVSGLSFGKASGATAAVGTAIGGPLGGLVGMAAPFVGARAAKFVTDRVFGRVAGATAETTARVTAGIDAFVNATAKASRAAPVLATKVLAAVRYAPSSDAPAATAPATPAASALATAYRARADEIRAQVTPGPTGPTMRPEARARVAAHLAPIAAASPLIADRLETLAARKLEFLATKLPVRPDIGGMQFGPDRWQPSDMQMRTFARYAAAVEDPHAIVERLADGSITPEDAEAMRTVYPEMHADITRQIVERLPTLRAQLPYQRRLALSFFSGAPVDPAMDPRVLASLQGNFINEPGSDGGTQAPTPQPQFGSVKAEKPTPAQSRNAGDAL